MPRQPARQIKMDLSAAVPDAKRNSQPAAATTAPEPKGSTLAPTRSPRPIKPQVSAGSLQPAKSAEPVKPAPATGRAGASKPRGTPKSANPAGPAKVVKAAKPVNARPVAAASPAAEKKRAPAAAPALPQKTKKAPVPERAPARRAPARVHRVVDLAQPHNTNTQEGALLFALQILSGAQATWEHLRQVGASDTELEGALESYFPVLLGVHAERQKGFYIGRKPEPFFLWGNVNTAGGCLTGPALLKKVRAVLCLPERRPTGRDTPVRP